MIARLQGARCNAFHIDSSSAAPRAFCATPPRAPLSAPSSSILHQPKRTLLDPPQAIPGDWSKPNSRSENENDIIPRKLGAQVISSITQLKENVKWSTATIMRNDAASLDGTVRLLHVSVEDHVEVLYGKKIQGVVDEMRWIDNYTMPGQCVALRVPSDESVTSTHLFPLANSPYQAKRDSYGLDASIIEIVVDKESAVKNEAALAELGPGSLVEVSQVVGRGFASLFNSYVSVMSALEEGRPLILLCASTRGIVPMRALLNWTPIQAHATTHKVTALYVTKSSSKAAFITEWDLWRESGAEFAPQYINCDVCKKENQQAVLDALDKAMFLREGGFDSLGTARGASILIAGLSGEVSSQIAKRLTTKGVAHERILFCDFF
eukprot:gene31293-6441_t